MSDDTKIPLPPGHAVDIPARFIRQAFEHLQHTGERYVTFVFAGEMVADAVCYGISTGRVTRRMIEDQRQQKTTTQEHDAPTWTFQTITPNAVLEVIRNHGPINTKNIADSMGIARDNIPLRQRVRRVLESLVQRRAIRKLGDKRFPDFAISGTRVPRGATARPSSGMRRGDITDEMIIAQMQEGVISSRDIGDNLGFDRKDNNLRGKITEIIGRLIRTGRVRHAGGTMGTGRLYELVQEKGEQTTA